MAWYNTSWDKRKKYSINNTFIDNTITDFVVWVDLNDDSDINTHAKSDFSDVRVTTSDETTECAIYVTDAGVLFTKIPSVSSTTNTDFYIYYDNSGASAYAASATYGQYNVHTNIDFWKTFHETPASTTDNEASTTYSNNSVNNLSSALTTGGPVVKYWDFSNANTGTSAQQIDLGVNGPNLTTGPAFTISTWISIKPSVSAMQTVLADYNGGTSSSNFTMGFHGLFDQLRMNSWNPSYNDRRSTTALSGVADDTWIHLAITNNASDNWTWYYNGVADGTGTASYTPFAHTAGSVMIGATDSTAGSGNNSLVLRGGMTDLRISETTAYPAAWFKAEYSNSQEPTFFTISAQELQGGGSTPDKKRSMMIN